MKQSDSSQITLEAFDLCSSPVSSSFYLLGPHTAISRCKRNRTHVLHLQITCEDLILFNQLSAPHLASRHTGWEHIRLPKPQRCVWSIYQSIHTYKLTNPKSRCHKRTSCVLRGLNHAHIVICLPHSWCPQCDRSKFLTCPKFTDDPPSLVYCGRLVLADA